MTDRHRRQWRPTLRPDRALYQRVAEKVRAAGGDMNERFEAWLLYMDGQAAEPPPRPSGGDPVPATRLAADIDDYAVFDGTDEDGLRRVAGSQIEPGADGPVFRRPDGTAVQMASGWVVARTAKGHVMAVTPEAWADMGGPQPG